MYKGKAPSRPLLNLNSLPINDDDVVVLFESKPGKRKRRSNYDDDCFEIPAAVAAASDLALAGEQCFTMYVKGLVVEDGQTKAKLGAIGIIVCNANDVEVLRASDALALPEENMRDDIAQLEAFSYGLDLAITLGIKNLKVFSLHFDFGSYQNQDPEVKGFHAVYMEKYVITCRNLFRRCRFVQTETNDHGVLALVRSLIASRAGRPFEEVIRVEENCLICFESVESSKMIALGGCGHRFCFICFKKQIDYKVKDREVPRCPYPGCDLDLNLDACKTFLAPEIFEDVAILYKESLIPADDKLYCPNPRCSNLMSKIEAHANGRYLASSSTAELTASQCSKCYNKFCVECKVPWHPRVTCAEYKKRELDPRSDIGQFKQLATENKWRQCAKCSHMVELSEGCYHIYCRCGHEFCYLCGCEYMDKSATCDCPLWTEENIIHQVPNYVNFENLPDYLQLQAEHNHQMELFQIQADEINALQAAGVEFHHEPPYFMPEADVITMHEDAVAAHNIHYAMQLLHFQIIQEGQLPAYHNQGDDPDEAHQEAHQWF